MAAIALPTNSTLTLSKPRIWTGRVLSTLVTLFLLFDAVAKVMKEHHVLAASAEFGFGPNLIAMIGGILLFCTALYAVPRTAVLGSLLLTGYLGVAVVSQMRVGHGFFECSFPVIFGVLAWAGLYLRDSRLSALLPVRE